MDFFLPDFQCVESQNIYSCVPEVRRQILAFRPKILRSALLSHSSGQLEILVVIALWTWCGKAKVHLACTGEPDCTDTRGGEVEQALLFSINRSPATNLPPPIFPPSISRHGPSICVPLIRNPTMTESESRGGSPWLWSALLRTGRSPKPGSGRELQLKEIDKTNCCRCREVSQGSGAPKTRGCPQDLLEICLEVWVSETGNAISNLKIPAVTWNKAWHLQGPVPRSALTWILPAVLLNQKPGACCVLVHMDCTEYIKVP